MPTRAVPVDAPATLAFAGLFWVWKEYKLSAAIVVAFDFFLRTGEIFTLRRKDVEFFHHSASLQLLQTKTSGHQIHSERLLAWDAVAIRALTFLCRGLQPGDLLVPESAPRFRSLWHKAVAFFALQDHYILPYSLRRGGSTSAVGSPLTNFSSVEDGPTTAQPEFIWMRAYNNLPSCHSPLRPNAAYNGHAIA